MHSSSDLRKMVKDYICSPSDVKSETDSDNDSNFTDEERTADSEIAADVDIENSIDEALNLFSVKIHRD